MDFKTLGKWNQEDSLLGWMGTTLGGGQGGGRGTVGQASRANERKVAWCSEQVCKCWFESESKGKCEVPVGQPGMARKELGLQICPCGKRQLGPWSQK